MTRTLYLFEGNGLTVNGEELEASTGAVVRSDVAATIVAIGAMGSANARTSLPALLELLARKCSASGRMSSGRSRSAGRWM